MDSEQKHKILCFIFKDLDKFSKSLHHPSQE